MQMTTRFSGGCASDFGSHDYEAILLGSLERFVQYLKHVELFVEDVNGPRGGIDKRCRLILNLRRMPPVVIRDQDAKMSSLIQRVAQRACYTLSQKADRRKKRSKSCCKRLPQAS